MRRTLIIFLILASRQITFGQGYGLSDEFYPEPIPENKSFDQKFWNKQVKKLTRKGLKNPNDAILLYKLAIAKSHLLSNDLTDVITLLDRAIEADSTQARFYAVRGIIKYDWGAFSPDYDIAEGCPDIRKAINMGLEDKLSNNEAINGILKHPSCNSDKVLLGDNRNDLDEIFFSDSLANKSWKRADVLDEDTYFINLTDSTFSTSNPRYTELDVNCYCEVHFGNSFFKMQQFRCDNRMITRYIYGFFENGDLYLTFENDNFDLNDELPKIVKNRLGWVKFTIKDK